MAGSTLHVRGLSLGGGKMVPMPELLFELGCEELPAASVERAYTQLGEEISRRLTEAGIAFGASIVLGTPRRLIVSIADVGDRQPDAVKEMRGPGLKGAYDATGNPTPALLGFCRGQGVEVSHLRTEGDYVWVDKKVPGRPTIEVLSEILPASVRALTFDKSMRWGSARMRFARPIRWILASFGGTVVPFDIEGVESGLTSMGHRFYSRKTFTATTLAEYLPTALEHCVQPDSSIRERMIRDQAAAICSGTPDLTDALVSENVYLTEWPTAIEGNFATEYLELPEAVLVTAMAKHERMFPVRDADGKITSKFVWIRNSGKDDAVRAGNEWVLNARFNDAKFFYDEDKKTNFDEFLAQTDRMLYQEKLGSVRARGDRLAALCALIVTEMEREDLADFARTVGLYAKADLSTGLVSEMASLQGLIGAEYAARANHPGPVCDAISAQYDLARLFRLSGDPRVLGTALFVADQIDKLAGYLGQGIAPTGSSDPMGLRRSVGQLIEIAWSEGPYTGDYAKLLLSALKQYETQSIGLDANAASATLKEIFEGRYQAMLSDVRHDIREAALQGPNLTQPISFRAQLEILSQIAEDTALVQTALRPINISAAAEKKGIALIRDLSLVVAGDLDSKSGEALLVAAIAAEQKLTQGETISALKELQPLVSEFFESTMIMADDPATRAARLGLAGGVAGLFQQFGDLTKLEG